MIGVYKITNPSGKIYIGQSWNIKQREQNYLRLECKGQPKLYNSLNKYGWNKHNFEIIHILPKDTTQEILNQHEIKYWKQYLNNGFEMMNIKEPGSNGKHVLETKEKISKSLKGRDISKWNYKIYTKERNNKVSENNKGKVISEEHKQKISENNKGNKNLLGYKYSEESKLKQSLSHLGKKHTLKHIENLKANKIGKGGKIIICINDNNEFNTLKEASKFYNINPRSINNILLGLAKKTRKNFLTFKYK